MKAVLDTNVVVSAFISRKGAPIRILDAWRSNTFIWCSSSQLLAELDQVLRRDELRRHIRLTDEEIEAVFTEIGRETKMFTPAVEIHVLADEPDNRVLETAVSAGADYIVTGDRGLLALNEYEGTAIVTPAQFLALLTRTP